MNEKKENNKKKFSIAGELFKNYRKHFLDKTSMVTILFLVVAICLVLAFLVPISLLISVPFLVLPFLVGVIIENYATNGGINYKTSRIFRCFSLYYNGTTFGCFNVLGAILKTVIVYLISNNLFLIIFHFSIGLADPSYASIINSIGTVENIGGLNKLIQDLLENQTYNYISNLTLIISFGLASYTFIHHVLTHSFKLCFNAFGKKIYPMQAINMMHKRAFPRFRKDFYFDYYSLFWFIILLFIGGYVGGSFIGLKLLNLNGLQCGVIGLALGILVSIYFIPYIYDTYQVMSTIDNIYYLEALVELYTEGRLNGLVTLSEAEKESITKFTNELKNIIEETKKEIKKKDK